MPKSLNEVRIAGHMTSPKQFGRGPHKFGINTGGWTKKDGSKAPDCWHRIIVWPNIEGSDKLAKGKYVKIEGRLEYPPFDANKHGSMEEFIRYGEFCHIIATSVTFGDQEVHTPTSADVPDSDLPW